MPELQLQQLRYESDTWKRLLSFLIEENIHQKNRLSEILKGNLDKNLLDEMESFQTQFVQEDRLIFLLRMELAEYDKLVGKETFEDGMLSREAGGKRRKLRTNIADAEVQFGKLKSEFNSYLSENIYYRQQTLQANNG